MQNETDILIYQTEDGSTKIDVRLENETVWLTQKAIAELYQTTTQKITDIYATSGDYHSKADITQEFFAAVQNKLHFAIHSLINRSPSEYRKELQNELG